MAIKRLELLSLASLVLAIGTPAVAGLIDKPAIIDAAKTGTAGAAHRAIDNGDDPDVVDDDGMTPMLYAVQRDAKDIVAVLIKAHARLNKTGPDGKTPLFWAAEGGDPILVELLLQAGAKVDDGSKDGVTPLMAAARRGNIDAAQTLLKAGADRNRADYSGRDVESWAEDSRNPRMVELIRDGQ